MTDETLGIIYLIKRDNNLSLDEKINLFLRELCNTDHHYNRVEVNSAMRKATVDYLLSCDNMGEHIKRFFSAPNKIFHDRFESEMMMRFLFNLEVTQPTDDGKFIYVNDFRENPFQHFKSFQYPSEVNKAC